ncbi:MAG TPA: ATP-binding protein [Streptomyces sp.]|nr:ATP-binding protein [Streptomyces sp.]
MPEPPSYAVQTGRGASATTGAATVPGGSNGSRARHGRSPGRSNPGDAAVRSRLIRLAVLPAGITAVVAAAVTVYALQAAGPDSGPGASETTYGATLWGVLVGALLLVCAVLIGAALFASSEARGTASRYAALRRSAAQSQSEVRSLLRRLEQGERPSPRTHPALPEPSGDGLDMLAHELALAQRTAEAAVTEAAALVRAGTSGSDEKVEVFVNLARRLQSLVHREIELLDELENEVEDPDLLKGLFHVDHLATRIRRHAENLAVLGGAVSRRQWTRPVTMTEVLRSAIAEVEQYSRVKLVPPIEGTLRGHAVADVIHLLAELVENATIFSAPQTQVLLRAQHVTAGLAVEVEDRGLGMTAAEQTRMNALLSDPEQFDVGEMLSDGRIGLFVVSALARRHGIVVQLQSNIYGGIQAVLVLPRGLLGEDAAPGTPGAVQNPQARQVQHAAPAQVESANGRAVSQPLPPTAPQGSQAPAAPDRHERVRTPDHPEPAPAGPAPSRPAHTETANGLPQRPAPATADAARSAQPLNGDRPASAHGAAPAGAEAYGKPAAAGEQGARGIPAPRPGAAAPAHCGATAAPAPPAAGPRAAMPDGRPELPKRRRQEHLVPELREPPRPRPETDEPEAGHDPSLMAAFRRGTSLAEGTGEPDETPPA